ncbi:uncharacterized protein BKCO1_7000160 [Diplodia corticola]|uniref:Uncharacterized protein n=1 Tax=Diplodia corticola TaxID=236234 RepID=A0A1J9SCY2_9PEZI|nr:uncharacterized protein BKCO1_7000160 [Diplodia corticola]OJD37429.1 hypothetical protein BKCO1_7000160 [Diplodia corticola]
MNTSPDQPPTEDLVATLSGKWGDDKLKWLPSQSSHLYKDLEEWPRRLLVAITALASRTHTDEDRDFVIEQLQKKVVEVIGRDSITFGPWMPSEQLADQLAWDAETLLTNLTPAFDRIDGLSSAWGDHVKSWLQPSAIPHSSALAWDYKLLRLMARFATTYPRARLVMKEHCVPKAIKTRTMGNPNASLKVTSTDWGRANSMYANIRKTGRLPHVVAEIERRLLSEQDAANVSEAKQQESPKDNNTGYPVVTNSTSYPVVTNNTSYPVVTNTPQLRQAKTAGVARDAKHKRSRSPNIPEISEEAVQKAKPKKTLSSPAGSRGHLPSSKRARHFHKRGI